MAITKSQKEKILSETSKDLKDSKSVVFSNFGGVSVSQMTDLRHNLSSIKAKYKVIKRTLLNLALKKIKADVSFENLSGPIGVAFSEKEVNEILKALYEFSKKNEGFRIIGALELTDNKFLNQDAAMILAKLPSKEVLLGNLVYVLSAPLRNLVCVLDGIKRS